MTSSWEEVHRSSHRQIYSQPMDSWQTLMQTSIFKEIYCFYRVKVVKNIVTKGQYCGPLMSHPFAFGLNKLLRCWCVETPWRSGDVSVSNVYPASVIDTWELLRVIMSAVSKTYRYLTKIKHRNPFAYNLVCTIHIAYNNYQFISKSDSLFSNTVFRYSPGHWKSCWAFWASYYTELIYWS